MRRRHCLRPDRLRLRSGGHIAALVIPLGDPRDRRGGPRRLDRDVAQEGARRHGQGDRACLKGSPYDKGAYEEMFKVLYDLFGSPTAKG